MVRLLAALVVLVLSAPAFAGPLPPHSRWAVSALTRVDAISVAGRSNSSILALTYDGRIWRSLDGAKSWTPVSIPAAGAFNFGPSGFALGSPHDSRNWYVDAYGGPLVTRDAGETWSPGNHPIQGLAFGADPNLLFQSPAPAFFGAPSTPGRVSLDRGVTWKALAAVPDRIGVRGIVPSLSDGRVVYVFGTNGVVRSDDQGTAWRDVTPVDLPLSGGLLSLAVDATDPDVVYASTFVASEKALYSSRNGGKTWTRGPLEWIVNVAPDPATRGRAFAFSFDATVHETRDGGLTWTTVEGAQLPGETPTNSGPPWMTTDKPSFYRNGLIAVAGSKRVGLSVGYGTLASVDLSVGALALGSDLWWNPAAPGTGLTITQHSSNQVFMVWYAYDASGKQVWRVMPGGTWSDRTISGALYETDGPPYFQGAFDTSRVKLDPVGVATMEFGNHDNGTLVHASNSGTVLSRTPISRMQFGDLAKVQPENYADIWYNAAESGWGLGISQQGDRVFATWYVYGDDGEPMWVIMPDSVIQTELAGVVARQVAQGDIYTTRGNPGGGYTSTKVGTARITFRTTNGLDLEYSAFGKSNTVQVTRIPF